MCARASVPEDFAGCQAYISSPHAQTTPGYPPEDGMDQASVKLASPSTFGSVLINSYFWIILCLVFLAI